MPLTDPSGLAFYSEEFPTGPGVYVIQTTGGLAIYVGETQNLQRRIEEHRADREHCLQWYTPTWVAFESGAYSKEVRMARETTLREELKPFCNPL